MELTQKDYTVREVAALGGVTVARVRQLLGAERGLLRGTKRAGSWFVKAASVRRWLESRE